MRIINLFFSLSFSKAGLNSLKPSLMSSKKSMNIGEDSMTVKFSG